MSDRHRPKTKKQKMACTLIMAGGQSWYSKNEELYTVICADDGVEYIVDHHGHWVLNKIEKVRDQLEIAYDMFAEDNDEENEKPKRLTQYNIFLQTAMSSMALPDINDGQTRMKIAAELWQQAKNTYKSVDK